MALNGAATTDPAVFTVVETTDPAVFTGTVIREHCVSSRARAGRKIAFISMVGRKRWTGKCRDKAHATF
jgi:hypothetical protein